jgi:predicted transcriptional regulator
MTDEQVKLKRPRYSVAEVAHILNVTTATVRTYFHKPSQAHEGRPLLKATKEGIRWFVSREDFQIYLKELYGAQRTE